MSEPTTPDDDRQRRLEEAMAEYLIAADAGRPPEPESFLARYPDLRAELFQFLADLSGLAALVEPLRPAGAVGPEPGKAPEQEPTLPPSGESTTGGATTSGPGTTIAGDSSADAGSTTDPAATAQFGEGANGTTTSVALPGGTRVRYFGDYELIRELGHGGMGIVYKARQISLNRLVALKMIRLAALAGGDDLRRFQNEAEAVATLDHPHIVPILEVGHYDGQRYFTMKLIGGTSLNQKLTDYVADPRSAAKLLKQVAEAVHHAHQRGILHRDLKPANILLDERGEPFVTDFGLAKRVEGDSELTLSGAIMGTPAYMAPEQASGRRGAVTTVSDVYGLGAILYAVLTGRAPFGGDSVEETLDQVRNLAPSPPSKINPRVPRDLESICLKAMAKEPGQRYTAARELAEDLSRFLDGVPIRARRASGIERTWRWCRRNPAAAGFLVASSIATLAMVGVAGLAWGWSMAATARNEAIGGEDTARHRAYAASLQLAERDWRDANIEQVMRHLEETRPPAGNSDLRGFEWYYLDRLARSQGQVLTAPKGTVVSVAYSRDGRRIASTSEDRTVKLWDAATGSPSAPS